jgi:hypothetical protein
MGGAIGAVTARSRASCSDVELSRYIGAGLTMIDRHSGHLARDGREQEIRLLDHTRLVPAVRRLF